MAVAKSRDPHARLKLRATGCESRLRGRIEPASTGFVDVAEGFSPTASDVATATAEASGYVFTKPAFAGFARPRRRASPRVARGFSHRATFTTWIGLLYYVMR